MIVSTTEVARSRAQKRILHCIPSMKGGGAERQLVYLCDRLVRLGWDVEVAMLDLGVNAERLQATGAKIRVLTRRNNYDPMILWQLIRRIKSFQPSVVHTWLPMMDVLGGIAAGLSGTPLVASERNSVLRYRDTWKDKLRAFVISSWADTVVANSHAGKQYMQVQTNGRVPIQVVVNGVPIEEIETIAPAPRNDIGVDSESEIILFAGSFDDEKKNLSVLFRALQLVLEIRPRAVAILCGDGPSRVHWMSWVQQQNWGNRLIFPGYVRHLSSWMKTANVFVFPSTAEGCPNVVLEAMACSCPLVVSDIPAHREILAADCALLIPPERHEALADAIIQTLVDAEAALLRAQIARERVSQWSVDVMACHYHDIYLELLAVK